MRKSSLFHHRTIKKLREKTDLTYKQKEASVKWLSYLDAGDLKKEKSNYPKFMKIILQDILGFPMEDIGQEDENVDMLYPQKGEKVLCVECKGTGTAELDALQHRDKKEHETPIKQTWDYVGSTGSDYGICTNYKEFVLMTRNDYPHMHWFDFESIRKDQENLKEFVGIFSKESLIDNDGFVEDLHKESVEEEREFTTEFYKLFHQTRLMMIQAFQEKEGVTKDEAINYAQLYLNRLIFIFFAEDNKFLEKKLFMETVKKSLNSNIFESSKSVSNQILDLFSIVDGGSDKLGIVGFGGELFREKIPPKIYFLDLKDKKFFNNITSKSKLKIKPDNAIQNLIDRERKLNPIIKNLLMMNSFDFTTDLNVNILGQIFEQSISDLEELKEEKTSRRKKDGVYYTPEYITDYICRNTIIPYLSKSGTNSTQTLIYEYENNIEELEKKFREIKILDPACGSGAFLIKAVDILLEIHKEIMNLKQFLRPEKYSDNGQAKMDKWNEESEAKEIIENNIYGVDINPESAEITKLALFLKIAERGKKLSELTNNIKVGNSLISDKSIDEMAFDWEEQFPEKFDIVIGNPPYVRVQQMEHFVIDYIFKNYASPYKKFDLAVVFMEKALQLVKEHGIVGMITSSQWMKTDYGYKLREIMNGKIKKIIDFGSLEVFKNVKTYPAIFIAELENSPYVLYKRIKQKEDLSLRGIEKNIFIKKSYSELSNKAWSFFSFDLISHLKKRNITFDQITNYGHFYTGALSGMDDVFVITDKIIKEKNLENKFIFPYAYNAGEVRKFTKSSPTEKMIYPYKPNSKGDAVMLDEDQLKQQAPNIHAYLSQHKKTLSKRMDSRKFYAVGKNWYKIVRPGRFRYITPRKLLVKGIEKLAVCGYVEVNSLFSGANTPGFIIEKSDEDWRFFLGLFNSKLISCYLLSVCPEKLHGYFRFNTNNLNSIPIPNKIDLEVKKSLVEIVRDLIKTTGKNLDSVSIDMEKNQDKIDELVYEIYGITEDERKVIEEEN